MKKKTGIIIGIVIILVVLIVCVICGTLYFMTDLFKSSQELFWKYAATSTQIEEMLSNENEENQKIWKDNHSYTSKGDLNISVTKETGTQEIKLGTTEKHSQTTGRTYKDITLYNGETENLKVSYINSDDIYALYCKDIYEPYYIGFRNSNVEDFIEKMYGITLEVPDSVNTEITLEEREYLLDTYSNTIVNNIPRENYSKTEKTKLVVNNQNYEAYGYCLELTNDDIRNIMSNILTKAKDDERTMEIITKISNGLSSESIKANIEKLIESLQKATTPISYIKFYIYPINKNIIKMQITDNETAELTIDIDNTKDNKKSLMFSIKEVDTQERYRNSNRKTSFKQYGYLHY